MKDFHMQRLSISCIVDSKPSIIVSLEYGNIDSEGSRVYLFAVPRRGNNNGLLWKQCVGWNAKLRACGYVFIDVLYYFFLQELPQAICFLRFSSCLRGRPEARKQQCIHLLRVMRAADVAPMFTNWARFYGSLISYCLHTRLQLLFPVYNLFPNIPTGLNESVLWPVNAQTCIGVKVSQKCVHSYMSIFVQSHTLPFNGEIIVGTYQGFLQNTLPLRFLGDIATLRLFRTNKADYVVKIEIYIPYSSASILKIMKV